MAADGRARLFIIFLDTYNTALEGSARMREPLIRFLERLLGPDDMVALMTPEIGASDITFGRRTTVISRLLEREWTWGKRDRINPIDEKESRYEFCYGRNRALLAEIKERRREKLALDALDDLVVFLQGVRDERKAIVMVGEGWRLFTPNRARLTLDDLNVPRDCESDRVALWEMDSPTQVQRMTQAANRSNVTFYPIYARGLTVFDAPIGPDPPPSPIQDAANLRARHTALRILADDTDGTAIINTNDIDGGMKRIVSDLSSYYLLGYTSTNSKLDGKFRTIKVRVKRPGVDVRARKGYLSLRPEEVRTSAAAPAVSVSASASAPMPAAVDPRAAFRLRSAAWVASETTSPIVWLVGEMDQATKRDPVWAGGAEAEVSVTTASGARVASLQVPFVLADAGFTMQLPREPPLTAGNYTVRVRVTPKSGQSLPLSDLARLTVPDRPVAVGQPVMLRRGPSTGVRYLATADPRFHRTDRLRLEYPTVAAGTPTARLLDRSGSALPVPVTVSERSDAAGFRWLVVDAVVAPLAPGDYAVELGLGDVRQTTSFKVIP
jgi:VWFA-related protein